MKYQNEKLFSDDVVPFPHRAEHETLGHPGLWKCPGLPTFDYLGRNNLHDSLPYALRCRYAAFL